MIKRKQNGFTIVELMISLVIGAVLLGGVLAVFVGMKSTSSETSDYGELQENGRFALSLITEDLLAQNFWGGLSGDLNRDALNESIDPAGLAGDCVGAGVNNASFPQDIGHFRTIWGETVINSNNMTCIDDAVSESDILQIKRVIAAPVNVSTPVVSGDFRDDRYYLVTNSNNASLFAGNTVTANIPTVNNGQYWEYQHHVYYVRNETQGTSDNQVDIPVLMRGTLQNSAVSAMNIEPIVDGIESIRFLYGVDTDNDGAVNAYIPPVNMTNAMWDNEPLAGSTEDSRVIAVQVFILVRSVFEDKKYTNQNTYKLGDVDLTFDDNYRRLLFSSTTTLHNARPQ